MDPITVAVLGVLFMFLLILLQVPIGISMAVAGIAEPLQGKQHTDRMPG